jgi:hypothetical protein
VGKSTLELWQSKNPSTSSAGSLPNIQIVDINEFFAIQDVVTFGALRYSNTIDPAVPSATPPAPTSTLTPPIDVSSVNLDEDLQRILGQLPAKYHWFGEIFRDKEVEALAPHRGQHDIHIELEPGKSPPFGPIYSLSGDE